LRCFRTSFHVVIEQRAKVDTWGWHEPIGRKAFINKALSLHLDNFLSRNTLLLISERPSGGSRLYTLPTRKRTHVGHRALFTRPCLSQHSREVSFKPGFPKPILFSELQR
jgi:hypothetical protein